MLLCWRRCLSSRAGGAAKRQRSYPDRDALKLLVKQRPNALCINVVDAADFEGTMPSRNLLKTVVEERPIVLAINKTDRMPRFVSIDQQNFERRFAMRTSASLIGVHAVSAHTGAGLAGLVERVREASGDVIVFGYSGVGKSALARALAGSIQAAESGILESEDIEAAGAVLLSGGATGPSTVTEEFSFACGDGSHSIWDTPGLRNPTTITARLPEALTAPLVGPKTRRDKLRNPFSFYAGPGESLLITTSNVYDEAPGAAPPIALARIDVLRPSSAKSDGMAEAAAAVDTAEESSESESDEEPATEMSEASEDETGSGVAKQNPSSDSPRVVIAPYLAPSVQVSIVPTHEAPTALYATRTRCGGDDADAAPDGADEPILLPLETYGGKHDAGNHDVTATEFLRYLKGYGIDIALHGLGHVGIYNRAPFSVSVRGVPGAGSSVRRPIYPRVLPAKYHYRKEDISRGLATGEFFEGTLVQRRRGIARVIGAGDGAMASVLLRGSDAMNRALHGDRVAIRLLPKALWVRPGAESDKSDAEIESDAEAEASASPSMGEAAVAADEATQWSWLEGGGEGSAREQALRPCAEVVYILGRTKQPYIGVLDPRTSGRKSQYVYPRRSYLPKVRIHGNQSGTIEAGNLYAVRVTAWDTHDKYPSGVVDRLVGKVGETAAESEAILIESGVDRDAKFSDKAVALLPPAGWQPDAEEVARRRDIREGATGEAVCSVDPPGCVDIDDALHAIELAAAADGSRRFEVGVHIADVAHFVPHGSSLDTESSQRGTTFYLVDQRVNMVPDVLGENVASLHAGRDRLAFSVFWEMDEEANILSSSLKKTVIRSRASFSYKEAQARMDAVADGSAEGTEDPLTRSLSTLHALSHKLRAVRIEGGALRLASPEVKFELSEAEGTAGQDPKSMGLYMPLESNALVEEFMLLANVTVAKLVKEHFPETALLRRHPHPQADDFDNLHQQLAQHDLGLDLSSPTALASSLDACKKEDEPYFNLLTRFLAVRCMPSAEYVCAGEMESLGESHHHFGLATPIYSHFTSPIRRYADQVVHRMAEAAIGWTKPNGSLYDAKAVSELARSLNERHGAAKDAERASVALYSLMFFRGREVVETGYATFLSSSGFNVLVPRYGIEGWVHVAPFGKSSPFRWSETERTLSAEGCLIRPMDRVTVKLRVCNASLHPRLLMELLDDETGEPLCEMLLERGRRGSGGGSAGTPPPASEKAAA